MTDNTEQQAVGREDVREHSSIAISSIHTANSKFFRKAGPDYQAGDRLLRTAVEHIQQMEQLISRHYIAKEAVAAAIGEDESETIVVSSHSSMYGMVPTVKRRDGWAAHRNRVRRSIRQALNLDSGTSREDADG